MYTLNDVEYFDPWKELYPVMVNTLENILPLLEDIELKADTKIKPDINKVITELSGCYKFITKTSSPSVFADEMFMPQDSSQDTDKSDTGNLSSEVFEDCHNYLKKQSAKK